jgi:hypothetical protein
MNPNLKALYVAIHENKVEIFDTNLKLFVEQINIAHKDSRNYDWFYRAFSKGNDFQATINGKEYFFQKLL